MLTRPTNPRTRIRLVKKTFKSSWEFMHFLRFLNFTDTVKVLKTYSNPDGTNTIIWAVYGEKTG